MSKVVVGKLYANWCGACKALEPEWTKMEVEAKAKHANSVEIVPSIESETMEKELKKLNDKYKTNVSIQRGYPTIFKIVHGKVEYYEGERSSPKMMEWIGLKKTKHHTRSHLKKGGKKSRKSRKQSRRK